MAKNPKKPLAPTKKHLARMQREQLQRRYILLGSAIILVLVLATLLYGFLDQTILRARQPVAIVNSERITTSQFEGQARYARYSLVQNAMQTFQFMQFFGSDPSMTASFASQLQQVQSQLEPTIIGQTVIDQMVDNALIRQEAARRGITITEEEVNKALEEAFGFFPEGTPTPTLTLEPIPTSTLSPLQMTLVPPTATPTATAMVTETIEATVEITPDASADGAQATASISPTLQTTEVLTPTATPGPTLTPTPFTREGYQQLYSQTVENFKEEYDISEADLRYVIESQLYRDKVIEAVVGEIPRTQEQVWARHILVAEEQTTIDVLNRLNSGEDFCAVAAEVSTDTSNKDNCGDLDWFPREGRMDEAFSAAAFALDVGQTSEPVNTQFGWHIIQALGHEERPLSDAEVEQLRQEKFQDWLVQQRESSEIEIRDLWMDRVPTQPTLPAEITQFIQQSLQPPLTLPTSLPSENIQPEATPEPE